MSTTTFSWIITQLECLPQKDGQTDVVYNVIWDCCGIQEPENIAQSQRGQLNVDYVSGNLFTPYNQLTQQQILQWVFDSGVNKSEVESMVQQKIDAFKSPKTTSPNLPWIEA
jgi:hypothetical protein